MLAKSGEPSRAHGPPPEPWNATTNGLHHAVLFPTSDGSFRQSHHRRSRAAAPAAAHPKVRQTGVPHSGAAICRLCSHRHPAPYKSLCSPDLPQQARQSEPDGPSPAPSDGDPRDPQVPAVPQPSDQSPPPAFPWIMPSESGIHDPINFSIRILVKNVRPDSRNILEVTVLFHGRSEGDTASQQNQLGGPGIAILDP